MHYMPDPIPREVLLTRCPERHCARAGCQALARGGECLKTHFRNTDEMAGYLAEKLEAYHAKVIAENPEEEFVYGYEAVAGWYKIFRERQAAFEASGQLYDHNRILTKPRKGEVGYIEPASSAKHGS